MALHKLRFTLTGGKEIDLWLGHDVYKGLVHHAVMPDFFYAYRDEAGTKPVCVRCGGLVMLDLPFDPLPASDKT